MKLNTIYLIHPANCSTASRDRLSHNNACYFLGAMLIHGNNVIDPNGRISFIYVICATSGINPGSSIITSTQLMSHSTPWKGYANKMAFYDFLFTRLICSRTDKIIKNGIASSGNLKQSPCFQFKYNDAIKIKKLLQLYSGDVITKHANLQYCNFQSAKNSQRFH